LLVAPLFLFLVLTFFAPITITLLQGVYDPTVSDALPRTTAALGDFDGSAAPPDETYAALGLDLRVEPETLAKAAARLNSVMPGFRSLLFKTRDAAAKAPQPLTTVAEFTAIDARWGEVAAWATIRTLSGSFTDANLLAALDLQRDSQGTIQAAPPEHAIFTTMLWRTIVMAAVVTVICLAAGFPLAYLIVTASPFVSKLAMFCVLLPLWTSILVRRLSWSVLLQREGVISAALSAVFSPDMPFDLMYNRGAVYAGMVHVLLPFMVLALYGTMKSFPGLYLRAAASLGARPLTVFRRVYLPLVMPGVVAGCLLVFIQALGAYVTPVLLGGPGDQTIAGIIAFYVTKSTNWGLAAALSLILLVAIVALSAVYRAIAGARTVGATA